MTDKDIERIEKGIEHLTSIVEKINTFPPWMSLAQASKYCPLSRQTLLRMVENGEIWGRYTGGKWIVSRESIDNYFNTPSIEIAQFKAYLKKC